MSYSVDVTDPWQRSSCSVKEPRAISPREKADYVSIVASTETD